MARMKFSERFWRPPRWFTIEPYLRPEDQPITSDPQARRGRIVPLVVQPEGKAPMAFDAWRNGARPAPDELFGDR